MDTEQLEKAVTKELETVEARIFALERAYLEETSGYGNIIRGWDNILKFKHHRQPDIFQPKKVKINNKERLFSLSSATSGANTLLRKELEQSSVDIEGSRDFKFARKRGVKKKRSMAPTLRRYNIIKEPFEEDYSETKTRSPSRKKPKAPKKMSYLNGIGTKANVKLNRGAVNAKKIKKKTD